jgi:hypothetical protein
MIIDEKQLSSLVLKHVLKTKWTRFSEKKPRKGKLIIVLFSLGEASFVGEYFDTHAIKTSDGKNVSVYPEDFWMPVPPRPRRHTILFST